MDSTVIIGAVTAAITGLISYFAAARKMGGQIKTTTADKLWSEAHDIRENLRSQLIDRDARIDELDKTASTCLSENTKLRNEVNRLTFENTQLSEKVEALTKQVREFTNGENHA